MLKQKQQHQHNMDSRHWNPDSITNNKYVFFTLPRANPRKAVYLNVKFTECEIVKLNQMKSWLVSGGGIGHV